VSTVERADLALLTDLYELTMAAAYEHAGMVGDATFELFVRSLPPQRRFLVVAGVTELAGHLSALRVAPEQVEHLRGLDLLPDAYLDGLADLRFEGDLWGVPDGEVAYAGEPLVRVTAPLPVAQLVETLVINLVASQTLVASKAARVALACGDRSFVDFSARRDHGPGAALQAARGSWIAGAAGTSLVLASQRWGLPLSGTMAHAFVMAHDDERDAFRAYARTFPDRAVLLIDTYDTVQGACNAVEVARELASEGVRIRAVRLDSGDLASLAIEVRAVLDAGGLGDTQIVASGDLDEHRIAALLEAGAPIDAFGVGTQMGTSADAPALGAVYKLVEDADGPRVKLSPGKATLPGRKQVWRSHEGDVVALDGEDLSATHRALLEPLLRAGAPVGPAALDARSSVADARERCAAAVAELPVGARRLDPVEDGEVVHPVVPTEALVALRDRAAAAHRVGPPGEAGGPDR
jgi:nicotinate phosphoribosyltransferase